MSHPMLSRPVPTSDFCDIVFGPYATLKGLKEDAKSGHVTEQDYVMNAVDEAIAQGSTIDRYEAFSHLCRLLGIEES